jgi:hypothetical protein
MNYKDRQLLEEAYSQILKEDAMASAPKDPEKEVAHIKAIVANDETLLAEAYEEVRAKREIKLA